MAKKNVTLKDEASNELNPETVITQVKDSSNAALFTEASGTISTTSGHTINGASISNSSITSDKLDTFLANNNSYVAGLADVLLNNADTDDLMEFTSNNTIEFKNEVHVGGYLYVDEIQSDDNSSIIIQSEMNFNANDIYGLAYLNFENGEEIGSDLEFKYHGQYSAEFEDVEYNGNSFSFNADDSTPNIYYPQLEYSRQSNGVMTITGYSFRPDSIYKTTKVGSAASTTVDLIPHLYRYEVLFHDFYFNIDLPFQINEYNINDGDSYGGNYALEIEKIFNYLTNSTNSRSLHLPLMCDDFSEIITYYASILRSDATHYSLSVSWYQNGTDDTSLIFFTKNNSNEIDITMDPDWSCQIQFRYQIF